MSSSLADDLLLGELVVRARLLSRDHVARALGELSRRRQQGREADLASVLVGAGLMSLADLERVRREPGSAETRDDELSLALKRAYENPDPTPLPVRPSGRLASAGLAQPPPAVVSKERKTGRFEAQPAPPRRKTGRFEPDATAALPASEVPRPDGAAPVATPAPAFAPPPPPPPKMIGRTWGSYEILGEVARGAMGAVYRARDKRRNLDVALKVLLQGNKAEGEDLERFKREARSLARLAHPSIVRVYDYGVQEGCPFLTMDFVAGTTLESILRGGGLPIERGLVILEEVAEAVDHAHSRGVVHRDLKPANVLIGADGRARITDFGLAKILDEGASLTRSGDLIGTPLYMSPEQVSGDLSALGPSSDVWSLGVTLYLLLTGEQPFGAKTIDEVSKKVLHEEPVPPRKLRPEISEELEKVCAAALAKDPKRRYQSAGELSRDLSNYLHGKPVLAGRVTTGVRARRFARAVQLRLGLRAVLLFLLVFVASASLTMLLLAPTHGGTTDVLSPRLKAQLARLQDVVRVLGESPPEPASAEEARLNLLSAHKAVRDAIDPGEGQALSVCDALLAKGHALLAEHPRDPAREDEWAARELLAAADCAPDAVPGTGASRALMDKLTALARALDPLERTHDSSLRKHAKKVLGAIGETAAGPLVSGRVHLLAGDFEEAERLLTLALERTKGSPGSSEREQAGLASIDALLALELYEDARSRAQELEAEASSREASLERSTRLELCVVRAARQLRQADPRALELVSSYLDATSQGKPGSSRRREALRAAVALERALAALDREKPAAALLELEGTHALRGDPRVAVARARARVLQGDEHALSELDPDHKMLGDAIREAALAREVPPPLRADAALALLELALITGDEKVVGPALATLEQLAAGNDPPLAPPSARRVALALAAPALDSAVSALAGAWSSEPGKARGVKQDELTGAVARLEPRALEGDIDAQALLLVLVGVGGKLARADTTQLAERVRAPAPREPSREVAIARALDLACSGLAVFERSRQNLDHALWSEDEKPVAGADDLYAATSSDRASASPLVLVARDRATQALAFRLRPGEHLLGRASSSADAHALVANASHILDVAGRREPFSPAVRRARAEVALAWAQVGPAASTKEASAAGRVEAAAAALLDPFDAASCAALARAHASCGDEARSRTWARRARAARRGALADHDAALVVALLSPENHSKDGEEIEERAWLEIVAGNMDVARSLVREAALLDDEERAAIAGGQPLAVGRLVPPTPDIRSRLAQARLRLQAQGTPWAELWAQASLSLESVIDDGLEVDGGQFSSVSDTPTGDAVNDLWRALGFVVQVEAAKESPASGAASARKLLESVVQARPRSLAPRVLADYVDILASPETGDVAEAAADLERLERIAWARGTLPALLSAARALAEARLLREGVPRRVREGEGRVRRLLERPSLAPSWNRWKLERGR